MGTDLVNDFNDNGSLSQISSTKIAHMRRVAETSCSAKICLATEGTAPDGQHMVSHPVLVNAVEGCNAYPVSHINKVIHINLPLYTTRLSRERDYLHKYANMPNIPPSIINGVMQCSWLQHSLDEYPHLLSKHTTVLNFFAPPITSTERRNCDNLNI